MEYFEYQQELHEEILDEYKIVDRIIGKPQLSSSLQECDILIKY